MARKTPSRQELRKQVEAAETRGDEATKKKKKTAAKAKRATVGRKRTKEKVPLRKRMMWVVYNASMKEEARFPYDQRDEADKKAEQLRKKAGKLFFVQPVKETISDSPAGDSEKPAKAKKAAPKRAVKVEAPEKEADEEEEPDEEDDDEDDED